MLGRCSFVFYLLQLISTVNSKFWLRQVLIATAVVQLTLNIAAITQFMSQCGMHTTALWDISMKGWCVSPLVETYLGFVVSGQPLNPYG